MATPKQQYASRLNAIAKRYGSLEQSTVTAILRMLRGVRDQAVSELGEVDDPALGMPDRIRRINRLIDNAEKQAASELRGAIPGAVDNGLAEVVEPLRAIGINASFLTPNQAQLNVLADYSADLIRGITEPLRAQVNMQLRQVALGQIDQDAAMRTITDIFGKQQVKQGRQVVTGISAKAERDVRTELQRVFNLSSHSQQQATARVVDGLLKRWIATADSRTRAGHLDAHRRYKSNPIPVDEPFVVKDIDRKGRTRGTAELMYPVDPSAPPQYTINCRCKQATIHPDIGVIGMSLDGRVASMLQQRDLEARRILEAIERSKRRTRTVAYIPPGIMRTQRRAARGRCDGKKV